MDGRRSYRLAAEELSQRLGEGAIVALQGDLGAGKTTFAKMLIPLLTDAIEHEISSPTFTYMQSYDRVHHFDLYRLEGEEEFLQKGFGDYLGEGICIIEWPERIEGLLPEETIWVKLTHVDEGLRTIHVS